MQTNLQRVTATGGRSKARNKNHLSCVDKAAVYPWVAKMQTNLQRPFKKIRHPLCTDAVILGNSLVILIYVGQHDAGDADCSDDAAQSHQGHTQRG